MKEYPDTQSSLMQVIGSLADGGPENQDIIVDSQGVETVVDALENHTQHASIQLWGCWSLINICHEHRAAKLRAGQHGALNCIANALKSFEKDLEIQRQGCMCLCNLLLRVPENHGRGLRCNAYAAMNQAVERIEKGSKDGTKSDKLKSRFRFRLGPGNERLSASVGQLKQLVKIVTLDTRALDPKAKSANSKPLKHTLEPIPAESPLQTEQNQISHEHSDIQLHQPFHTEDEEEEQQDEMARNVRRSRMPSLSEDDLWQSSQSRTQPKSNPVKRLARAIDSHVDLNFMETQDKTIN